MVLGDLVGEGVAKIVFWVSELLIAAKGLWKYCFWWLPRWGRAGIEPSKIIAQTHPILLLDQLTSQMDIRRTFEVIGSLLPYLCAGGFAVVSTRDQV